MTGHVYKVIVDLGKPNDDMIWNTLASVGDSKAHRVCVKTVLNGQIIDTAKLRAMLCVERQDTATRYIDAAFDSEGYAVAELDKSCYEVEGRLKCTMQIADGDETIVSVARIYLMVTKANGEIIIDPSHTLPSVRELLAEVANMRAATKETVATNTAVKTAENQRVQNENARIAAEKNRATAEDQWVKNESARVTAEKDRASAESRRSQSEDARATAEKNRSTAEENRNKAEKERASAEQARADAEQKRAQAENARVQSFAQYDEEIGKLSQGYTSLSARQNILIGTKSGTVVSAADVFAAPLCGLSIYGKCVQDGTPTPNAPVPIVSAGKSGTIEVKVTGKNLLNLPQNGSYPTPKYGVTWDFDDGIVSAYGTVPENETYPRISLDSLNGPMTLLPGKYRLTYVRYNNSKMEFRLLSSKNRNNEGRDIYLNPNRILELKSICEFDILIIGAEASGETIDMRARLMVTTVDMESTDYEPYHEQTLTLQTPNGLPGIPVSSGGNYTDASGQQWLCDEIDMERGVRVQRVDTTKLDPTKSLTEQDAALETPIATPLDDEIAAYKALTTYAPTTVVRAADVAGIKLDYQRDVNLVIKNLEDAIASMTTT